MGKARVFSTASVHAMADSELTGQDWRVYLWVSLHDGMSLLKGKGAGCYAANKTIFEAAQCDYASGCRSLSKLVKRGHLVREQLGRSTRYRVTFGGPDRLQACNITGASIGDQGASADAAIYCSDFSETRTDQPETGRDYIPLRGELDPVETGKLNSLETAHLCDAHDFSPMSEDEVAASFKANGRNRPEGLAAGKASIVGRLSPHFANLEPGAKLVRFEEAFSAINRNPYALDSREREQWSQWLLQLWGDFCGEQIGHHAERLYGEFVEF